MFSRSSFPDGRKQSKKVFRKAALNAKQRLEGKSKYSEETKNKGKDLYRGKKANLEQNA